MYISRIELENIRAFKKLDISLVNKPSSKQLVIIGPNSTCKTTLLRCIAIGVCNEGHAGALLAELPGSLVGEHTRRKATEAVIRIHITTPRKSTTVVSTRIMASRTKGGGAKKKSTGREALSEDHVVERLYRTEESDNDSAEPPTEFVEPFICGYGAGRGAPGTESWTRYRSVDSVYSLFRYDQPLQNPELTLHRLRDFYKPIKDRTEARIIKTLGLSQRHKLHLEKSGVMLSGPNFGADIPFESLADGYRSTATWLLDLIGWAMIAGNIDKNTGDICGIVLLDEIEQHLHPQLQIEVLTQFQKKFPRLQLITTTHSPLVALCADQDSLVSLKRRGQLVSKMRGVPNFSAYSVDEVIEDESLFDSPVYSERTRRKLESYKRLAQIPSSKRTTAQSKKLRNLAEALGTLSSSMVEASPVLQELVALRSELGLGKK